MKSSKAVLLVCIAFFCNSAAAASPIDFAPLAKRIEETKRVTGHPSGTAVAVIKDGEVIYQGYFGYSDIGKQQPVTADTAFYIASSTKPLFALNVLLLEAQGRLDTTTSLQSMFPSAAFKGFDANAITVRDLLVHTSGIDNQPLVWATAFSGIHDADSLEALVAASYPSAETAHGQFDYSNVGYNITSIWTTRILGTSWQDQLRQTVFDPVGMPRSSATMSRAQERQWQVAKPYTIASQTPGQPLYLEKADDTMHAAGGVVATAPDLARFLVAELNGGKVDGEQLLPAAVIARSQQDQVSLDEKYQDFQRSGYGWGWYSGQYKQHRMLHHFGGFAGYHAHLSFMPDAGIALVVLNNEDMLAGRLTSVIADYVYGSLLGDPETEKRVAGRFVELNAGVAKMQAGLAKRQGEINARPWRLSLPKAAYTGSYHANLLGDIEVTLDPEGRLLLRWGRVASMATGFDGPEQVRVEFVPNSGQIVSFKVDDRKVTSLTFGDMRFDRTP
ncbi:MAG: hypothetical protein A3E01_04090 [Gammaproteobacteria bacterium RIFCSPHIGHO2_12_FULL_63_22]|nr:MAG: hypothetical protein A3E01_04090 [Gammaproteobacteria bacterium RIFCSPHIGHO2_12_FULL_63_22]